MPAGRPTKYKPEYAEQLLEYFNIEAGNERDVENSKGQIQAVWSPNNLPTLAGFACKIGVARETIWRWEQEHVEFCNALKQAKEHQERILVENALRNGYNPAFAIFTAKNLLKWHDKQEHEISGPDGRPIEKTWTIELKHADYPAPKQIISDSDD